MKNQCPAVPSENQFFGFVIASLCLQNEIQQFESFQQSERAKDAVLADRARIAVESLAAGRAA
jgi:hypothetical protein